MTITTAHRLSKRIVNTTVILAATLILSGAAGVWGLTTIRQVSSPVMAESTLAALGGLRSIISEIVWFRAERLKDEGKYVELSQLASTLTFLEPHTPEVWSYAAWNLSYNISAMMKSPADRWKWVHAGVKLLRDEGLKLNPDEPELYRELALLFEIKLGADIDSHSEYYREEWREIVKDVAQREAWHELGMDKALMEKIETRYKINDWGDPQLSAVYWAYKGLDYAKGVDQRILAGIIHQARTIYAKRKDAEQAKAKSGY